MDQLLFVPTITESCLMLPYPLSMDFIEISKSLGDLDLLRQERSLLPQSTIALNTVFRNIALHPEVSHVSISCLGALDLVPPSWRRTVQCFLKNCKTGQFFLEAIASDCHVFFEKNSLIHKGGVFLRIEYRPSKKNKGKNWKNI